MQKYSKVLTLFDIEYSMGLVLPIVVIDVEFMNNAANDYRMFSMKFDCATLIISMRYSFLV